MKKAIFLLLIAVLGLSAWHLRPARAETADWWEGEALRVELLGQVNLAKFRLAAAGDVRGPEELAKVVAEQDALDKQIASLRTKREQLSAGIVQGEEALVKLGEDRLRDLKARAVGKEWTEFATADRTYQDAKVVAVTDAGVTIRHRDGSARLRYRDLTDSQRQEFGLDEAAALAAVQEERKQALAYEQWLEDEVAAMERDKAQAAKLVASTIRLKSTPAPVVAVNVPPVQNPLKESAKQFGNGSRYYSGSSYYRPRRTNFYYYYTAPRYCAPRNYCAPVRPYPSRPTFSPTISTP